MESVFPYGSESLGVKEHITSRKTLKTVAMWFQRCMMGILWTDIVANNDCLE